jgi:hypothetical protein
LGSVPENDAFGGSHVLYPFSRSGEEVKSAMLGLLEQDSGKPQRRRRSWARRGSRLEADRSKQSAFMIERIVSYKALGDAIAEQRQVNDEAAFRKRIVNESFRRSVD